MKTLSAEQKIYFILRLAVAMCFIGHGVFGIITKPIWANYFGVFGIEKHTAFRLMPFLGAADILMGLIMLFYPIRAIAAWLVVWGLVTASLRPLSGEPFAEMIERAGNYGAPLALLFLVGGSKTFKGWFARINAEFTASKSQLKNVTSVLTIAVFLLLMGHAWLNLIDKKSLILQYQSLGFNDPQRVALYAGLTEVLMAIVVLVKPVRSLLLVFLVWKIGTELFYPHWEAFEWIERGGSYGCILALWYALGIDKISVWKALFKPSHHQLSTT